MHNYIRFNLQIECHIMWLFPHGFRQLLLLLIGVFHHIHGQGLGGVLHHVNGQDLGDIMLNKRIVFHLFSPEDMGNVTSNIICTNLHISRATELPQAMASPYTWFLLGQAKI